MEVFIARQPIFDRRLRIVAYELLFRGADTSSADVADGDAATSAVVLNAFTEVGLDALTGGHPAFVNLTRRFLLERSIPLPQDRVVLEILEDIEPDPALLEALRQLAAEGYQIALDDFVLHQGRDALLPFADIVKVEIAALTPQQVVDQARTLRRLGVRRLLAEKVETFDMMKLCRAAGFDYFQGYFLSRPRTLRSRSVPSNRLPLLQLLAELHKPDLNVHQAERIIGQDLSLSYKLLRYLGSPLFALRDIDSIRAAIVFLGKRELANWASLLAMSVARDQPQVRIVTLLTRGRMCERMARRRGQGLDPVAAFTIGMFSGLDAVLDAPLATICAQLPLTDEARQALLEHRGPYGELLAGALAHECGDWSAMAPLGFTPAAMTRDYLEAIEWADQRWRALEEAAREEPT